MTKKDILFIIAFILSVIGLVWVMYEPPTNYYDLPLEYRIRIEQRMITW